MKPGQRSRQRIRYLTASDGVRLAWAEVGEGPLLVKAANWLSHLEYDWDSPVWQHWIRFFSDHFRFVRYDERGCGMSDWNPGSLSIDRWVEDLESVIDAAQPTGPVILLGISQGAAICMAYAVRHPERVSHLVLYGGYARGSSRRGERTEQQYRAMVDLTRIGWGNDNPTFRQVFTSRFIPGGTDAQVRWWNELCLKTATGETAARLFEARGGIDITDLLPQVRTPTLVLHARDDEITAVDEGRRVAAGVAGGGVVRRRLPHPRPAWTRTGVDQVRGSGARLPAGRSRGQPGSRVRCALRA